MSGRSSLVLLFLLLWTVPLSAVPSFPHTLEQTLLKAQNKKLYEHREWLQLGHYRKKLFGGYQSLVKGENFFFSPVGVKDPKAELELTIKKLFFSPDKANHQCEFLARRDFLARELEISSSQFTPCKKFDEWISKLNPKRVTLIFASSSFSNPASSFGHVFLKIDDPKKSRGLLDYGINFAARTGDSTGALYAWKGLLGYFPGTYAMAPYHHVIKEYTNLEGRDLWEYPLNLTEDETIRMMKHLLELDKRYFDYYFLDDNCALLIAKALEIARPQTSLIPDRQVWVLPVEVLKAAQENGMVEREIFRASLQSEFSNKYRRLQVNEKLNLFNLDENSVSKLNIRELETAQSYISLKQTEDPKRFEGLGYKLSIERSKKNENWEVPIHKETSPLEGKDPTRISLGQSRTLADKPYQLNFRAAGHDLLDGTEDFTEYEIFKPSFEWRSVSTLDIAEISFINILSSQSVTLLDFSPSWGVGFKWQDGFKLPVKFGYSFDILENLRLMSFASLQLQEVKNTDPLALPGLQPLLVFKSQMLSAYVSYTYRFQIRTREPAWTGGLSIAPTKNLELRYERKADDMIWLSHYF